MPTYTQELASTAKTLFDEGLVDPTAKEIAQRHLGRTSLGREVLEGVRKRLPKIKGILERDYGVQAYLVNEEYYELREIPATLTEAKRFVPASGAWGQFTPSFGLRKLNGVQDVLWEATIKHNLGVGAGHLRAGFNRTVDAASNHQCSDEKVKQIVRMAYNDLRPTGLPERFRLLVEPPK